MIRLFTIEDHPIIITGLRNLFRPSRDEIEIVGSANNVDEVLAKGIPEPFDIFMLDLWIPESHPVQNVKKLKDNFPDKPIIIFTSEESSTWQRKMFEAGISAYLLKNADKNELKITLEKVANGQTIFSGFIEPEVESIFRSGFSDPKLSLTEHQKEFVILLSQGLTQQQIADNKNISVSTVEKTLKNIREKCNAKSNTEMVRILFEKGII